ncbi:hypothetical protein A1O1_00016 [Capronia coronata CBS 617.96]|uniref:Uncharacterized protein n=1 Tax=Capronia coronata CBS 617.96 TaxID=1182541 RepID=W9YQU8_9EURO|nr:uncharacterized protein A1O1_00016 [Capronia coronata CBS 617.96]EXJ94898.1 hypothetical protein A1O1_00016 [Capronia coronata CBS 617.96]
MNGNSREQSSSSDQPLSTSPLQPDHVYLRVIYLVTGDPRPPLNLGQVDLGTTILALKNRIQNDLPEHPTPLEQRLIYQGRPLLRNEATLREVLRLESGAASGPLPYTIHIVINPRSDATPPRDPPSTTHGLPPPPATRPTERVNPFRAVETSAARLQESLARIQQQIEVNRADLLGVQQRIGLQHHNIHHHIATGQPHHHVTVGQPLPTHAPFQIDVNGQAIFAAPTPLRLNGGQNLEQPDRGLPQVPWIPTQNGRGAGQTVPSMFRNPAVPPSVPQPVLAPQPNAAATSTNPQPNAEGTQGHPVSHAAAGQQTNTGLPPTQPVSASGHQQVHHMHQHPLLTAAQRVSSTMPEHHHPPHVPVQFPSQFARSSVENLLPTNAVAWIVSSPAGPEALLFQPGHGFFATTQQQTPQQSGTQYASQGPAPGNQPIAVVPLQPAEEEGPVNINVRIAQPRRNHMPAAPALAQVRRNEADNDLFAFLIQRGWLFLRLYLFMFVFSEPGTWKRWLLIVTAAIVCLQPRNGPFVRALAAARRHLDNLIAPPAPRPQPAPAAEARQQPQVQPLQNAVNEIPVLRPANVRGAVQITPEEAAARLNRQHHDGSANSWRDTFYRIEQSTALFLASLIPGVGERHVRAREEARREAVRLEQERIRAEQEAATRAQAEIAAEPASGENMDHTVAATAEEAKANGSAVATVDGSIEQSASSSVQIHEDTAEVEGLRNRNI